MSKYLSALVAFLFLFSISATIVLAQEADYEGIEVPTEETPVDTTPETETSTLNARLERLRIIQDDEAAKFEASKTRRMDALTNYQKSVQQGNITQDFTLGYRLSSILVSARYHKTLDLYANYLSGLAETADNTSVGFQPINVDNEMDLIEEEMIEISQLLNEMDLTIGNISGTAETDLANLTSEMQAQSEVIKDQLETTRLDILDLAESLE